MRRVTTLLALIALLSLAMSGIAFAAAEVTIGDDGLDPESVEADVREDIVWSNASDEDVTLVGKDPAWTSGAIQPGATFSIKVTRKGTYEYASEDGSLQGEIIVGGAATGGTDEEEADEGGKDEAGRDKDDAVKESGEDDDAGRGDDLAAPLPKTGIDVTVPGALSVLLIALGAGLLLATRPTRSFAG